jgi:hypothetical protein
MGVMLLVTKNFLISFYCESIMSTISISTTLERKVLGTPLYYMAIAVVSIVVFGSIPAFYNSEQGVVWSLHDALHPLIGIVLGPIVGPIVSAAGVLLSNIVTPYTAFNLLSSITYFPMMAFVTGLCFSAGGCLAWHLLFCRDVGGGDFAAPVAVERLHRDFRHRDYGGAVYTPLDF